MSTTIKHHSWWNAALSEEWKQVKLKDRRVQRWKRKHPDTPVPPQWLHEWLQTKKTFKAHIQQAKLQDEERLMEAIATSSPANMWTTLNMKHKTLTEISPTFLKDGDQLVTQPEDIAHLMLKQFCPRLTPEESSRLQPIEDWTHQHMKPHSHADID